MKLAILLLICFNLMACDAFRGDKGDAGDKGDTGTVSASVDVYEDTVSIAKYGDSWVRFTITTYSNMVITAEVKIIALGKWNSSLYTFNAETKEIAVQGSTEGNIVRVKVMHSNNAPALNKLIYG